MDGSSWAYYMCPTGPAHATPLHNTSPIISNIDRREALERSELVQRAASTFDRSFFVEMVTDPHKGCDSATLMFKNGRLDQMFY
jgi:hypothetical protein